MELVIKKSTRDYVVIRVNGEYNQHSHYKDKRAALRLIETIEKGKKPNNLYDQVAAKRLLTKEEYEQLRVCRRKQMYYNVGCKSNLKSR